MGGDNDDIVAPVVAGSELVLVNDALRLCLGKIGKTKVCFGGLWSVQPSAELGARN